VTLPLLFDLTAAPRVEQLASGAVVLRGFTAANAHALLDAVRGVIEQAPLRRMVTPSGHTMSVAMTNCGTAGWVTDRTGYRYATLDPATNRPWPAMPTAFQELARAAAAAADLGPFVPDACLINCYEPGSRLSLHQDKDERDFTAPIVSASLGLPAVFVFGGLRRTERPQRVPLAHGDVVVWGGPARLRYHGVLALADGEHPLAGRQRFNLTLRKAL
jgi:alkylated DNA repair protein (DNA oxidative demethylase)